MEADETAGAGILMLLPKSLLLAALFAAELEVLGCAFAGSECVASAAGVAAVSISSSNAGADALGSAPRSMRTRFKL